MRFITKINITLFFILICFLQLKCYAGEIDTVYLESNKKYIEKGEEIEVSICIENNYISAFNSNIYFDDTRLEYVSQFNNTNLLQNQLITVWFDETGVNSPKKGELTKFSFIGKEEGVVTFIIDGEFYDEQGQLINNNFKNLQIQIGKKDNEFVNDSYDIQIEEYSDLTNTNLETLAIENTLLYQSFNNDTVYYEVELANNTNDLNILAIPENENATIQIIGDEKIVEGDNLVKVIVISEDNSSQKIFEINCHKRNEEEEINYEEKIKTNKEKLDQIYRTEKINKIVETTKEAENQKIIYLLIVLILFSIIIFIIVKNKK